MAWWAPSKPEDLKPVPWLAPRVIAHLESLLTPEMNVIEHGSGGSTLWFAERVKTVTAYEDDLDWALQIQNTGPENIFLYDGPLAIQSRFYDLLLIDGEPVERRAEWISSAPNIVKPRGWVVLDNANRPEYAKERAWLQSVCESFQTFDGNTGGTQYLVTDFYQLKGE